MTGGHQSFLLESENNAKSVSKSIFSQTEQRNVTEQNPLAISS